MAIVVGNANIQLFSYLQKIILLSTCSPVLQGTSWLLVDSYLGATPEGVPGVALGNKKVAVGNPFSHPAPSPPGGRGRGGEKISR